MAQQPEPYLTLKKQLADLREEVRQLRNRSPYTGTGLVPTGEGEVRVNPGANLNIDGNANVSGTLNVAGPAQFGGDVEVVGGQLASGNYAPGVSGWQIQGGGAAEFNDLTLRNNQLQNPVQSAFEAAAVNTFSTTTSYATHGSVTIPAPDGFNTGIFMASAFVNLSNTTGSAATCDVRINIGAAQLSQPTATVAAGGIARFYPFNQVRFGPDDVLPLNSTTDIFIDLKTSTTWPAGLSPNIVEVRCTAIFMVT